MPKMIHPEVEAIADVVTVEGFHAVWAPRGWLLLGDAEAFASEVLGKPVKKLDDLKVDELKQLVSARGLEYPPTTALKADVLSTFRETFAEQPAALQADGELVDPDALVPDPVVVDAPTTDSSAPADTTKKGK